MKRKTPVKLIGYLLCVALLCGLLAGCGNDKVQEEQNDNVSADTIPEDVVVHTDYGDLHYGRVLSHNGDEPRRCGVNR